MATYVTSLANAIVVFLGQQDLGKGTTIARRRVIMQKLEEIVGTVISVLPVGVDRTLDAECVYRGDLHVWVVVQCVLDKTQDSSDGATANAAAALSENIAALLVGSDVLGAECQSANLVAYDPKAIVSLNLFDATIKTVWRVFEDTD